MPSTTGLTQASLPFFLPSQNERTSGIVARQAGFGQVTVRAQSHAITVACVPDVPLTSFPEGEYRLEIKVTDKLAEKTVTRNVNFTVGAQ